MNRNVDGISLPQWKKLTEDVLNGDLRTKHMQYLGKQSQNVVKSDFAENRDLRSAF